MSVMGWDVIRQITGGHWAIEPTEGCMPPVGIAIDTRELHRGQAFVAYVGQRVDGHRFLSKAESLGAGMCVVTDEAQIPAGFSSPTLLVSDPTHAITCMARHWRSALKATVIGVTGSNGKTTTSRLVYAVLNHSGGAWVSSKSHNNAIGVPMSVLNTPLDARYAVYELGTSSPGEIERRAQLVEPDIAMITSIGRAHLEELGSIEGVCNEKACILDHASSRGIIPSGVDHLEAAITRSAPPCVLERLTEDRLTGIAMTERSVSFTLDQSRFVAPLPGRHNAQNSAMAVLVGRACGMDDDEIAKGLAGATLPEMRLDRIEIPTRTDPIVVYNDAYNANPDSTRAALAFFGSLRPSGDRVVILGDMLELGSASQAEHAAIVAELVAEFDPDGSRIVLVGRAYSSAARQGAEGIETCIAVDDHAMSELAQSISPGDRVLLKGSRGMGLERLVYILINRHTSFANAGSGQIHGDEIQE